MSLVGYARVSSAGQSLDVQREQLLAAGAEQIFEEKRSGATTEGREQLEAALRYVRKGDVFRTHPVRTAAARPERRDLAQAASAVGCQFQGSSSSRRLAGMSLMRARTSASQA